MRERRTIQRFLVNECVLLLIKMLDGKLETTHSVNNKYLFVQDECRSCFFVASVDLITVTDGFLIREA